MIPSQTLTEFPVFADTGTKTQPGDAKYSAGFQNADVLPYEWVNWLLNKASSGVTALNSGVQSIETELNAVLTAAGITPLAATNGQVLDAIQYLLQAKTGTLANLTTTDKSNLVAAINEIRAKEVSDVGAINEVIPSGASSSNQLVTEDIVPYGASSSNQLVDNSSLSAALALLCPVGTIQQGLFTSAPEGWLICDGQTQYLRTQYASLWNLLQNIDECKGNGSTTFTTPDLRGKFLQGYTADNSVGTSMAAGLPDIQGTTSATDTAFSSSTGALKSSGNNGVGVWVGTDTQNIGNNVTIKASDGETKLDGTLQNDVYGKSDTVQPPALCVSYIIKY